MIKHNQIFATTLTMFTLLVVLTLTGCRLFSSNDTSSNLDTSNTAVNKGPIVSPIDGLPADERLLNRRPIAVMVENSPEARPQSGLSKANIVYEGITEGGITRFMAVYLQGEPSVIGPVRSARPHFIYTAEGYDAIYAHCGQSNEADRVFMSTPGLRNLDQLKGGVYASPFYREKSSKALEHTMYTSMTALREAARKLGWESEQNGLPEFVSGKMPATATLCPVVNIKFSPAFRMSYTYDEKKGGYARAQDGKPHIDRESKEQLVVKNVIIQNVADERYTLTDKNDATMKVTVVGSGTGYLLTAGQKIPIKWEKSSRTKLTKYTDEAGEPIPMQPGQTWVELVAITGTKIEFGTMATGDMAAESAPVVKKKRNKR